MTPSQQLNAHHVNLEDFLFDDFATNRALDYERSGAVHIGSFKGAALSREHKRLVRSYAIKVWLLVFFALLSGLSGWSFIGARLAADGVIVASVGGGK